MKKKNKVRIFNGLKKIKLISKFNGIEESKKTDLFTTF